MKLWMSFVAVAVILLLLADLLAFHDLFEPHTARDWLMLAASGLLVVGLVGLVGRSVGQLGVDRVVAPTAPTNAGTAAERRASPQPT